MKIWQLAACLGYENDIFNQYFPNFDVTQGNDEVNPSIVTSALSQSTKKMFKDNRNYLRLFNGDNTNVVELYTILEAYNNFGGDAITEVFDYGGFPL